MSLVNHTDTPAALENITAQVPYNTEKFSHMLLLNRDNLKTIMFAFAKGQELRTHTTPEPALLVMLEGVCQFKINGTSQLLIAGETISIPAKIPHSLAAATDFKMILVK